MIRQFIEEDMDAILAIWLDASIKAHHEEGIDEATGQQEYVMRYHSISA